MKFNKNQNIFPSDFHREIWWWAIGLVPPEDSLTEAVLEKCSPDVLDGCYQWYDLFNELCADMYANAPEYTPASSRQYRDILENISARGNLQAGGISWNLAEWEAYAGKINKSKAYVTAGITLDKCLAALERTGLKYISSDKNKKDKKDKDDKNGNSIFFSYDKYPKIFHAMQTMENSPNVRDTPVRHHFAHCEFRQLFKRYDANYNELLRRANDESTDIAHAAHDFAKSLKITRYIHFGVIKYKHKGIRIMDINVHGNESPAMRINIGTCAKPDIYMNDKNDINHIKKDEFYKHLLDSDNSVQEIFLNHIGKCEDSAHKHTNVTINGKKISLCPDARIHINPAKSDLKAILRFIEARKASVDQHIE
jgi:hypothetical protein